MSKHTTLEQLKLAQQRAKTEFDALKSKVDDLELTGGQPNVLEGVQVNGTALEIASKLVNILIATGTENGTISVNNVNILVKGLAAMAYKENVSAEDLAEALKTQIDTATSDITTLKGTGEGSVKKAVDDALNEFATNVTNDDVVNTYKELVDWAASHGGEAAQMAGAITALQNKLVLGTTGDDGAEYPTVKAYVEAVISGLNLTTELDKKVDKQDGYGLSKNDFTDAFKTKLEGIETATDEEVEAMLDEVWGSSDDD